MCILHGLTGAKDRVERVTVESKRDEIRRNRRARLDVRSKSVTDERLSELEARGLMSRKGFPESYDVGRLLRFLADMKSARPVVEAPVYSHLTYDIVPGESVVLRRPDILIVEGINVLQGAEAARGDGAPPANGRPRVFVSDFFDFSIYVDADEASLERWYVNRFLTLRDTAFRQPASYFHRFSQLSAAEAVDTAVTAEFGKTLV